MDSPIIFIPTVSPRARRCIGSLPGPARRWRTTVSWAWPIFSSMWPSAERAISLVRPSCIFCSRTVRSSAPTSMLRRRSPRRSTSSSCPRLTAAWSTPRCCCLPTGLAAACRLRRRLSSGNVASSSPNGGSAMAAGQATVSTFSTSCSLLLSMPAGCPLATAPSSVGLRPSSCVASMSNAIRPAAWRWLWSAMWM